MLRGSVMMPRNTSKPMTRAKGLKLKRVFYALIVVVIATPIIFINKTTREVFVGAYNNLRPMLLALCV